MEQANWTKQNLLFFPTTSSPAFEAQLDRTLKNLGESRKWTIGPPQLVDVTTTDGEPSPSAIGGILELFSPVGPNGAPLPLEVDRSLLEDVKALVGALVSITATSGMEVELELDGEYVGAVGSGIPNKSLLQGLIAPWEEHMAGFTGQP